MLDVQSELQQAFVLLNAGRFSELEILTGRLVERNPHNGLAWQLFGVSFLSRGRTLEAITPLERACELLPRNEAIWDNLGVANFHIGRHETAAICYERSLAISPNRFTTLVNAASNAAALGRFADSEYFALAALRIEPNSAEGYLNLGNAQAELGRYANAMDSYMQALNLRPNMPDALLSQGALLERMGRDKEAIKVLHRGLEINPDYWQAYVNLAKAHSNRGEATEAIENYRRAIRINPGATQAYSSMLMMMLHADALDPDFVFREHLGFGKACENLAKTLWQPHLNARNPGKRLKVGFVSGDLRAHVAAYIIEPLWRCLDRCLVEMVAYHSYPHEDEVSARLKPLVDGWHNVFGISDDALADRIRMDQIDILVDLSGHTAHNRLPLFARKPAPVQIAWLGYPGTTGLSAIDYRIITSFSAYADKLHAQFSERLVYLPCSAPFQPMLNAPGVSELPALKRGHVTFANFNRPNKIGARAIALWCRVLNAIPNARMLIGAVNHEELKASLTERFGRFGISSKRLDFCPPLELHDYLALHHEVDIILDTFPYAGGVTSMHALWMGVPVLTLLGQTMQERMGAAVLGKANLHDWAVESEEDYLQKATAAVDDLASLATLRGSLRTRMRDNLAGQPEHVARCFEAAFRMMWQRWCDGLPPENFEVVL